MKKDQFWPIVGIIVGVFAIILVLPDRVVRENVPFPQQIEQIQPPVVPPIPKIGSYQDVLRVAKEQNREMLLIFGADWCSWCKKLETTLASSQVIKATSKYIVYRVNVDKEKSVASKFNVSGLPCYCIVDANERVVKTGSGYKAEAAFLLWLNVKPSKVIRR